MMNDRLDYKVLGLSDIDEVLSYEESRLASSGLDENEKMMAGWSSKWRREALEHYFPLGWSMAAWEKGDDSNEGITSRRLCGYFIAQPLLFFQGRTQTLWVEHMSAREDSLLSHLVDIAYRMSREKHLQSVLFCEAKKNDPLYDSYKRKNFEHQILEIPTTKGGLI